MESASPAISGLAARPVELGFEPSSLLTPAAKQELSQVQKEMTITYADKSTHDFVLICKSAYQAALRKELTNKDVYRPLEKPLAMELDKHSQLARKWG